tara:strand:+ start:578 stop:769 length:192 start_codon:yes stop_codon:yes gene_type:complete
MWLLLSIATGGFLVVLFFIALLLHEVTLLKNYVMRIPMLSAEQLESIARGKNANISRQSNSKD